MSVDKHTHTRDCPDYKEAAADRKAREAVQQEREVRQQAHARLEWLEWFKA
jgi:hypothetical protein